MNSNATKINWTSSTNTLTITLGTQNSGPGSLGNATAVSNPVTPMYTTPITDVQGDPVIPSPTPGTTGTQF
jgi:hypothetical protein